MSVVPAKRARVRVSDKLVSPVAVEQAHEEHFCVYFLASGSTGNCTLIRDCNEWHIIDFGLGVETLLSLLRRQGIGLQYWREKVAAKKENFVRASKDQRHRLTSALLTHLHGDHFNANSLKLLARNGVKLWAHRRHLPELAELADFGKMSDEKRVNTYGDAGGTVAISPRLDMTPIEVSHDATATHGFIFQWRGSNGRELKFSYLADMGKFAPEAARLAADSDLLALEFNHDVEMERTSGRHPMHIGRVLGPYGHLSNEQAAEALRLILQRSTRAPRCVSLLHLSAQCNTPRLAQQAAEKVLREYGSESDVLVTRHRECAGWIDLTAPPPADQRLRKPPSWQAPAVHVPQQQTMLEELFA